MKPAQWFLKLFKKDWAFLFTQTVALNFGFPSNDTNCLGHRMHSATRAWEQAAVTYMHTTVATEPRENEKSGFSSRLRGSEYALHGTNHVGKGRGGNNQAHCVDDPSLVTGIDSETTFQHNGKYFSAEVLGVLVRHAGRSRKPNSLRCRRPNFLGSLITPLKRGSAEICFWYN